MDIWISVFEISGYISLGVFGCYELEMLKRWIGKKLSELV